jgi:hypothetical protein
VAKVVLRVKLVTELPAGEPTEVELACFERDEHIGLADLGLSLAEAKQLTAALQAEMVPMQVTAFGERRRWCEACGAVLASKGHYRATRAIQRSQLSFHLRRASSPARAAAYLS